MDTRHRKIQQAMAQARRRQQERADGMELADDLTAAGWKLHSIEEVPGTPLFRAIAEPPEGSAGLPFVRDTGDTRGLALVRLEHRLRRWWVTKEGRAGFGTR